MPRRPARQIAPLLVVAVLAAGLGGCTQFPELDAAASPTALAGDWPPLQPLPPLLALGETGTVTETTTAEIAARGAALRQRAAALRAAPTE